MFGFININLTISIRDNIDYDIATWTLNYIAIMLCKIVLAICILRGRRQDSLKLIFQRYILSLPTVSHFLINFLLFFSNFRSRKWLFRSYSIPIKGITAHDEGLILQSFSIKTKRQNNCNYCQKCNSRWINRTETET